MNNDSWRATANDKALNYSLLSHFGFPIPTTQASYHTKAARIDKEKTIKGPETLHQFFSQDAQYPIFIKPVVGSYGRGTFALAGYDTTKRIFTSTTGQPIDLSEILSAGNNPNYCGLLIQSCLQPHPEIIDTVGPTTSCVRVILVRDGDSVFIHRAFWKIARAHNITDNFSYGKHGNLLANVEVNSGKVNLVINSLWPTDNNHHYHPDTNRPLVGFQLPDWQAAIEQCIQASHIFRGLSLQSWVIAFCQQGPVLMELNTEPNLEVPQMLSESPFLDEKILDILQKNGWKSAAHKQS